MGTWCRAGNILECTSILKSNAFQFCLHLHCKDAIVKTSYTTGRGWWCQAHSTAVENVLPSSFEIHGVWINLVVIKVSCRSFGDRKID